MTQAQMNEVQEMFNEFKRTHPESDIQLIIF